jgi:hypothetical protein
MDDLATVVVADMVEAMGAKTGARAVLAEDGMPSFCFGPWGFPGGCQLICGGSR